MTAWAREPLVAVGPSGQGSWPRSGVPMIVVGRDRLFDRAPGQGDGRRRRPTVLRRRRATEATIEGPSAFVVMPWRTMSRSAGTHHQRRDADERLTAVRRLWPDHRAT